MISTHNRPMVTRIAGLVLCSSLLVTAAIAAPPKKPKKPATSKTSSAAIAAGKKVYSSSGCAGCHKINGQGGSSGPELTKVAAESKHTPQWLEVQVINPKAHDADSKMPPYGGRIKGQDLKNLVAYLSSLKK